VERANAWFLGCYKGTSLLSAKRDERAETRDEALSPVLGASASGAIAAQAVRTDPPRNRFAA
jgi:hypothetical protein